MDVAFWKFSNNPPNHDSVTDAMAFLMIMHSTCTGPFSVGISVIGVLDFVLRKNIHLIYCVLLVTRCRICMNIYRGSLRFFYIMLLRLDV